jgi:DNA-binding beta-propeller fold protein YncE
MRAAAPAVAAVVIIGVTGLSLTGCVSAGGPESATAQSSSSGSSRNSYHEWPTGPYQVVENWPKPLPDTKHSHDGWTWGSFGSVYAETPNRIWIAMRGELPLPEGAKPWTPYAALVPSRGNAQPNTDGLSATCEPNEKRGWERRFQHVLYVVDGEGNLVDEWLQHDHLFGQQPCGRGPHTIKMSPYDPEKHVWVIDDQLHVIYRFTYDGKLVKTFGQLGVRGRGPNTFDRPTDIAWLPDGTFFISDGYGGKRVAKFDAKDNFLMDWGSEPKDPQKPGPSEFNTPHSIAISKDRRVFVVDRGHQRMQVFDENGKFLDMWPLRSPHWPSNQGTLMVNHIITEDQFIWVGDAPTSRLIKFDLNGNYLYSWGVAGPQAGRLNCSHGITTDQNGNLFLADCFAGRVQKFTPQPNADKAKLVGQILRYPVKN